MPKTYNTHFQLEWLEDPLLTWVKRDKDNTKAFCKICLKSISVANNGRKALEKHARGDKHLKKAPSKNQSRVSLGTPDTDVQGSSSAIDSQENTQSCIQEFVVNEAVTDAEVMWALEVVLCKYSFNSCNEKKDLFMAMFKDSKIALSFACGHTKCMYIIKFGLAPYFKDLLLDALKESSYYAVSFDESYNKTAQKGQMDMLVRFWNDQKNMVDTRYLSSEFLGKAKAVDIFSKFQACSSALDKNKIIQVSSDGPNVNLAFLDLLRKYRKDEQLNTLLEIGTCGLHTIHNSFKTGAKSSEWKLNNILSAMYKIFDESPSRRADYEKCTDGVYAHQFCSHRWVENLKVAERAETVWPNIITIIKYWMELPKSKQPNKDNKSYDTLKSFINDMLVPVKMIFFADIARTLNKFLVTYQTEKPMVPFLADSLEDILRTFCSKFILKDTLKEATTSLKLIRLDFNDGMIHKRPADVDLGFAIKFELNNLRSKGKVKDTQILQFKRECTSFLAGLCAHMAEKCPLKFPLCRNARSLSPIRLVEDDTELNANRFRRMLEILVSGKQISSQCGENAKKEFEHFLNNIVNRNKNEFLEYDICCKDQRLDTFFFNYFVETKRYKNLEEVVKIGCTLSHGQASVERGFSINDDFLVENLLTETLSSLRLVYDHMYANDIKSHEIKITPALRKSVKASRQKYQNDLESKAKEKRTCEKTLKRKALDEEIHDLVKKQKILETANTGLLLDADKYALEAQNKSDLNDMKLLVTKSNALRKEMKENELCISHINNEKQGLVKKRDLLP